MKILFILSALFLGTSVFASVDIPYQDPAFGCITQETANRYVSDFNINVSSFGGMELCNSQVETKKLFNDIEILEKGSFKAEGSNLFIKGFVDAGYYYAWLKHETRGIERGNDVPYATAYNSGGYFTMQDGWAKLSTLGRVGTFVHEARHTAGFYHIRCNQGPYQDSSVSGCDTNYNYGGSHAVEMEYYARVAVQGTNFHPVYKKMARLMAIARSNIFFNTAVIQSREGILALTADRKEAHLLDKGVWYKREVPAVQGRLKRTSFGAVIFDGLKAFSIELYQNSGFSDLVADTYSYYKLLAEKNEQLKDLEEFDAGTKRYVVKITQNNKLAAYDFPNGNWGREQSIPFQVKQVTTAVPGRAQQALYLISNNGEIYNYQPQNQRLNKITGQWETDHKEVIAYKGQILVLKNNGEIQLQTANGLVPWTDAKQSYSGLVTTPVYDGFEVVKE